MIVEQAPGLLIAVPFLAAFLIGFVGFRSKTAALPLLIAVLIAPLCLSVLILRNVLAIGTIHYKLGGWEPPYGIEFVIDTFNGIVLVVIAVVALFAAAQSYRIIARDMAEKLPQFCALYLLSVTGLLGMTITGDAFNLYVFLEISSLSMYALIACAKGRAYLATFNYLILGSIGACFYLLGVGYLYIKT